MKEEIQKLQEIVDESSNIVFFGGAGVSTESGIPDFRSKDGLYNMKYKYPPEQIISRTFFDRNPEEFYRFYKDRMLIEDAEPNAAHKKLAELEKAGKLSAVVTQNIDGLHQKAGSKTVYELHGSTLRNYCMRCHKSSPLPAFPTVTSVAALSNQTSYSMRRVWITTPLWGQSTPSPTPIPSLLPAPHWWSTRRRALLSISTAAILCSSTVTRLRRTIRRISSSMTK